MIANNAFMIKEMKEKVEKKLENKIKLKLLKNYLLKNLEI
jgi:hypothetical protein